jgi:ABC-type dipeptide/oligopeptide/nickel transport system permease component
MHYLLYTGDHGHFLLFNVLPGDPARMMLDQNENSEQLALIKKYGFDKPIATQYLYYINDHRFHCTVKTSPITRI